MCGGSFINFNKGINLIFSYLCQTTTPFSQIMGLPLNENVVKNQIKL